MNRYTNLQDFENTHSLYASHTDDQTIIFIQWPTFNLVIYFQIVYVNILKVRLFVAHLDNIVYAVPELRVSKCYSFTKSFITNRNGAITIRYFCLQ